MNRPVIVSFINQHGLNLAARLPAFASCLMHSDVLLRDGVGMEVCLQMVGRQAGLNMNGTDFIPRLISAFAGRRVALFGTADPWTSKAAAVLEKIGCTVVAALDGFRPDTDYIHAVHESQPDLVILAMGNPRQEAVSKILAGAVSRPMVLVNGGAIADFLAQRIRRAPVWAQKARCEWAYRMMLEPKRLWRRYIVGGFSFGWHVMRLGLAAR